MILPDPGVTHKAKLYSDPGIRPAVLTPDPAGIPAELRAERRWVLWALLWKDTRWTKLPLRPDGRVASSTDPATWTDFTTAVAAHQSDPARFAGLGFVLGDGWCGVDLDDVRHPAGGLRAWAAALLDALPTYAECSPSDTGVKLFGRGEWAGHWHKRPHAGSGDIKVYDGGRFFTVTGLRVGPWPVADIGAKLVPTLGAGKPKAKGATAVMRLVPVPGCGCRRR